MHALSLVISIVIILIFVEALRAAFAIYRESKKITWAIYSFAVMLVALTTLSTIGVFLAVGLSQIIEGLLR